MEEKKPVEPKITAADFWRIWVQLHFPGDVRQMSEPEIFAASFMVPGPRPDAFFVEAWLETQKVAFAGREDMFSPTDEEKARDNAAILKKHGIELKPLVAAERLPVIEVPSAPVPEAGFVAPISAAELIAPPVKE